jgi:hypothetical protein
VNCLYCGKRINHNDRKHCSWACRIADTRVTIECANCHTLFQVTKTRFNRIGAKFCSWR